MLLWGLAVAAPGSDPAEDASLEHVESDEFFGKYFVDAAAYSGESLCA